jgi:hypothetical protein
MNVVPYVRFQCDSFMQSYVPDSDCTIKRSSSLHVLIVVSRLVPGALCTRCLTFYDQDWSWSCVVNKTDLLRYIFIYTKVLSIETTIVVLKSFVPFSRHFSSVFGVTFSPNRAPHPRNSRANNHLCVLRTSLCLSRVPIMRTCLVVTCLTYNSTKVNPSMRSAVRARLTRLPLSCVRLQ